jgi:hypothetical protein
MASCTVHTAGSTGFHRLPCLVEHGLIPGAFPARHQQQGPAGGGNHRVDGLLSGEFTQIRLGRAGLLLRVREFALTMSAPSSLAVRAA